MTSACDEPFHLQLASGAILKIDDRTLLRMCEHPAIAIALEAGQTSAAVPLVSVEAMKHVLALCAMPPLNGCALTPLPTFIESTFSSKRDYERWCEEQPISSRYNASDLLKGLTITALLDVAAAANYLSNEPLLDSVCDFLRGEIRVVLKRTKRSLVPQQLRVRFELACDLPTEEEERALSEHLYTPPEATPPEATPPSPSALPLAAALPSPVADDQSLALVAEAQLPAPPLPPVVTYTTSFKAALSIEELLVVDCAEPQREGSDTSEPMAMQSNETTAGAAPPLLARSFSSRLGSRDVLDSLLLPFRPAELRLLKGVNRSWREAARRVLCGPQWQARWLEKDLEWGTYESKGETLKVEARYRCKTPPVISPLGGSPSGFGLTFTAHDRFGDAPPLTDGSDAPMGPTGRADDAVAILKWKGAFEDAYECRRFLRELRLLRHFDGHPHIVRLRDVLRPPLGPLQHWRDVYLVHEHSDTDLHYVIHSRQGLRDEHVKYFIYQLLLALKRLHASRVVHGGLAPKQLGVDRNCTLRIKMGSLHYHHVASADGHVCQADHPDFSLSASSYDEGYRWYAAPEQLVENAEFDSAVDMWSTGCLLAELLKRKALLPGRDYLQQIRLIVALLGPPTDADLATVDNPQAVEYLRNLPTPPEDARLHAQLPKAPPDALDLASRLLVFRPSERLTAVQALAHPYFKGVREDADLHDGVETCTDAAALDALAVDDERWATEEGRRQSLYDLVREYHERRWTQEMMSAMEAERRYGVEEGEAVQ